MLSLAHSPNWTCLSKHPDTEYEDSRDNDRLFMENIGQYVKYLSEPEDVSS